MMLSFAICLAALSVLGAAQYAVEPDTPASPDTIKDCTYWQIASDTDTCPSISANWGLTLEQLYTYNPSLLDGCELIIGNSYCIEQNWGLPPPVPTSTTSSVPSTTASPTPTPSTVLGICEAEAGGYLRYCPQCLYRCNGTAYVSQCFYSVFGTINYYDSQCWQHGGQNCADQAVAIVCPGA